MLLCVAPPVYIRADAEVISHIPFSSCMYLMLTLLMQAGEYTCMPAQVQGHAVRMYFCGELFFVYRKLIGLKMHNYMLK